MATVEQISAIDQIGETAGQLWHHLHVNGATSVTRLIKDIDSPRDVVMQAIGWLAREGKIAIDDEARSKVIALR